MNKPAPTLDPEFVLRGSKDAISCLHFPSLKDSSLLVSGCASGEVRIWNLKSRRTVDVLDGHGGKGILTALTRTDGQVLSHGRDGKLNQWTLHEGRREITSTINIPCQSFCKCDLLEKDGMLASQGLEKSEVRVYGISAKKVTQKLIPASQHPDPLGMPMCLKFLSSQLLGVGYEDGSLVIWDLKAAKIASALKIYKEPVMCFDFSQDLQTGICGSVEDVLTSWVLKEVDFMVEKKTDIKLTNPGVSEVSIREDGKIVATAGWDSRLRIFGLKKLKPLAVLKYHTASAHCVQFSHPLPEFNNRWLLAAGSKDKHISVWSIYNG
ncbi:Guanine nucleotide-binding protein subunit beta-like protein 1 [Holothuria leucospilota]|uniref:Guanine nucleotide-binding protein subunit beta-like protein 1 n=1 Tax=Holothuria leucospilota TaxID=206669 RepID=A0A9Q1CDM4_HOLLE|nr:Guanine nucleotide-binding protein subunit beta-like protein 1 [Holothuria leucospilota]